jgi:hypothetical protein
VHVLALNAVGHSMRLSIVVKTAMVQVARALIALVCNEFSVNIIQAQHASFFLFITILYILNPLHIKMNLNVHDIKEVVFNQTINELLAESDNNFLGIHLIAISFSIIK